MNRKVIIHPSRMGALALWGGSDHYSLKQALQKAPFHLPTEKIRSIHEVTFSIFETIDLNRKYIVEYRSEERDCFISLQKLPEELRDFSVRKNIGPLDAVFLFLKSCWREPSALLIPFIIPLIYSIFILMYSSWSQYILHNQDILAFFSRPGCENECVRRVLSLHSLVGLLFFFQLMFLFVPIISLFFQAPRYRSAMNYRFTQSYSAATILVGIVVFVQLVAFFPFKQYGRFVGLGFDPKVDKMFSQLKDKR